jgi:hypothetical protein
MTASSLDDALLEFKRRGLIDQDKETGEIFVVDWPRWHRYGTPAARGALRTSIEKIQSRRLWTSVKNAFESTLIDRKGKEKEKAKAKTSSKEEEDGAPAPKRQARRSGIVVWTRYDEEEALLLEDRFGPEQIRAAVEQLKDQGKDPLPARMSKLLLPRDETRLPAGWWQTVEMMNEAGATLGLTAHIGEQPSEFAARIRAAAGRAGGAPG